MTFDPIKDLQDLTGKVAIVTGGNSGVGFATVQHLARKGAKVYLAARNESRATGALARLDAAGRGPGNGEVVWLKLDLCDPKTAQQAADDFLSREKRLDILINNAIGDSPPGTITPLGIQSIMIVSHFSPVVFTQRLLPLLKQTAKEPGADVRIINLSSEAHTFPPDTIRFRNIEDLNVRYEGRFKADLIRYGAVKLAVILWTDQLQLRMDEEDVPIMCLSVHPGTVRTEGLLGYIAKFPWPLSTLALWLSSVMAVAPEKGAYTPAIAAASPVIRADPKVYKGAYLEPIGKIGKRSKPAQNKELAKELWDTTERLLQEMDV